MNRRHRRSQWSRLQLVAHDQFRRHRRQVACAMALAGLLMAGASSLTYAWYQDDASVEGLQGIWPDFPPPVLSVDAFNQLDGKWAEWSQEAAVDVANLYALGDLSIEQQHDVLAKIDSRVRVLDKALRDPAYSMIQDELNSIHAPLKFRADLFRHSLALMESDTQPALDSELPQIKRAFVDAIGNVESDLESVVKGENWLPFLGFDRVRPQGDGNSDPAELKALAARLDTTVEGLNADQISFLNRSSLRALARKTNAYVAWMDTKDVEDDPNAIRDRLKRLIDAIELQDDSPTEETAASIRQLRTELQWLAGPAAAKLERLLRRQYMNYNLRLVADASFLSKLVATQDINCGPVRDYFMGANIYGNQTTKTNANLQFVPDNSKASFVLTLDGVSNSRTNAYARQATVSSVGQHHFYATKPVSFDGDRFNFGPADLSVNPNIRHTGISTKYDNIFFGLFRGMIQRRAMSEANARIPQGRAHAADEMRQQLIPEFNGQVEENFGKVNSDIAQLDSRLIKADLAPQAERVRTTSDRFLFDAAVRNEDELSGRGPNVGSTRGVGFTLQVHESLLNNMASRWALDGKSITETEVRKQLEDWFGNVLGFIVSFMDESGKPADPSALHFHPTDPIRFEVANGELRLILRAGITTEDGREVPAQLVQVPLKFEVKGDTVVITRGTVVVSPVDPPRNRALQITRAGIMRKKIEESIPDGSFDANFTIERDGQSPVPVKIERIDAEAGWLTIFGQ